MTAPYWTNGIATLYHADAREIPLPDQSVHCCVTSPPYWSLRDYGLSAWEDGDPACGHIRLAKDRQKSHGLTDRNADTAAYGGGAHEPWPGGICGHCGARQQATGIGLEPTLSEWVANILAVMREVRRVLRDDGTVWLNLGDAYAGSGKGMNADGTHSDGEKQASNRGSLNPGKRTPRGPGSGRWGLGDASVDGLPAKNLMLQPARVALALQQPWLTCRECEATHHQSAWGRWPDGRLICPECCESAGATVETPGWIVRDAIAWIKPNPMPGSQSDRPTSAWEYVFLCAKTNRSLYWMHEDGRVSDRQPKPDYVWEDRETGERRIREPLPKDADEWTRVNRWHSRSYFYDAEAVRIYNGNGWHSNKFSARAPERHAGENRTVPPEQQNTGANLRNAWTIPTQARKEKHYASFPDELPRKCILAGTSAHGVCANCGAPWRRTTATHDRNGRLGKGYHDHTDDLGRGQRGVFSADGTPTRQTVGWQPGCECNAARIPATVLDPFVGSGTTVAVAQSLGRKGIGLDLNPEYLAIARKRLEGITLPLPIGAWE